MMTPVRYRAARLEPFHDMLAVHGMYLPDQISCRYMHAALLKPDGRANFLIGVSDYRGIL
jgi:hypothetical protein